MRSASNAFAFLLLALASCTATAQPVSEAEAAALLARIDRAVPAKDIDTLADALSDGVQISMAVTIGTDVQQYRYDKREYLQSLRDAWAMSSDYRYRRSNQEIVVSGDAVTATADVTESAVVAGGALHSRTRETVTIERVGGEPRVTRIVGEGTVRGEPR